MKNRNDIRNRNLTSVRAVFEHDNVLVASQIAKKTGLSVVTVNAILEEMCKNGEMAKQGQSSPGSGRPSALYRYNRHYSCGLILFAYNSGDTIVMHTLVVNHFGEELKATAGHFSELGETHILTAIEGCVTEFPQIGQLLFGLPGTERHGVVTSGDFASFINAAFLGRIKESYRLNITFINDINAAAYGHNRSSEKPSENEVGIFFPAHFPPGAGIILQGQLYLGDTGFAGEIANLSGQIPWNDLYRRSEEEIAGQIYPILLSLICVINPGRIILYGEYLTDGIRKRLLHALHVALPAAAIPEILWPDTFESDFKNGLIALIKDKLWEGL